ncbi:MAG: HAD-IIA family hydrolase [Anaerolineae bacterium]
MNNNFNLGAVKALAIDMDGVVWRGNTPLPGFDDFFNFLHNSGLPYMLVSNNSTKTPAQYQAKLARMGATVGPEHVLTSSLATAAYMRREFAPGSRVYAVGQDGLVEALRSVGFEMAEDSSRPVEAVVSGLDFYVTYEKLKHATILIRRGAKFIATNGDLTLPTEDGFHPGAGSILAALEAASGVKPTVVGKPEPLMFEIAVQKMGVAPGEAAMLGDRLETDILGAQRVGLKTILVESGVDSRATIPVKGITPDVIFSGIDELVRAWLQLL